MKYYLLNEKERNFDFDTLLDIITEGEGLLHYFMYNDRTVVEIEEDKAIDLSFVKLEISYDDLKSMRAMEIRYISTNEF